MEVLSFFVLVGNRLNDCSIIAFMLLTPASNHNMSNVKVPTGDYVPFSVQSNKEDLNKLVNYYLNKEAKGSPVDYQVKLGNEVELEPNFFLSEELNMLLTFEPEALKNGDLILKQKRISIGRLNLPVPYVLKIIADSYKLPAGVDIILNQKQVYIDMQRLNLKNNMKVKMKKFDLRQNEIVFTILVPIK